MPYSTEYLADGTGIYHEGSGELTGDEMVAAAAQTHADPERARRLNHALVDLTRVERFLVTPEDLRRLAAENLKTAGLAREAYVAVVTTDDHVYGSIRMWEVFARDTGWETDVFRERSTAESWLELRLP